MNRLTKRWAWSALSRLSVLVVGIPFAAGRLAFQIWSICDSIPDLPTGALQMVGASVDGARFVGLDDRGFTRGINLVSVLVAFNKPMHVQQGPFRFGVKRDLIDCSKRQIEIQDAGFYDDREQQAISRVFDQKPKPFEPVDTEATLVCDHADFGQPKVVGFRAALAQTQAVVSGTYVGQ